MARGRLWRACLVAASRPLLVLWRVVAACVRLALPEVRVTGSEGTGACVRVIESHGRGGGAGCPAAGAAASPGGSWLVRLQGRRSRTAKQAVCYPELSNPSRLVHHLHGSSQPAAARAAQGVGADHSGRPREHIRTGPTTHDLNERVHDWYSDPSSCCTPQHPLPRQQSERPSHSRAATAAATRARRERNARSQTPRVDPDGGMAPRSTAQRPRMSNKDLSSKAASHPAVRSERCNALGSRHTQPRAGPGLPAAAIPIS